MPREIAPRPPMYVQIATVLAEEIRRGEPGPGELLPSESALERRFGVSRTTVRQALASLQSARLTDVRQGKGSIVRGPDDDDSATLDRTVTQTGQTYVPTGFSDLREVEAPVISRCTLTHRPAALLGRPNEDAISVDRVLFNGTRIAHRLFLPLATVAEARALADTPDAPLHEVYGHLRGLGTLTWTEEVTARVPLPDERTALGLTNSPSPLLITYRTTHGHNDQPLICEELKIPADRTRLSFTITPTKTAKRSRAK